jgi:putative transposase
MKTNIVRLRPHKSNEFVLSEIAERVDRLWNAANYVCRQRYIKGEGVPGYSALCKLLPKAYPVDYARLPSDIAQEVLKKLSEAWASFFALSNRFKRGTLKFRPGLVKYRKNRSGKYRKDFIPVKGPRSYDLSRSELSLPLPADLRTKGRLRCPVQGELRYRGKLGRLELNYDRTDRVWRATVSVETPERKFREHGRAAAIDLGIRISASLSIEGQDGSHHFRGREMVKEFEYWTRRISDHQKELAKRKLKSSRRLSQLYQLRRRRLEHAQRAVAKAVAGLCRASGVGVVYIGWPKGIRDNVQLRKDWRGRLHNYWNFDRFAAILISALERQRILGKQVGERGTSSTCPWTLDKKHKMSRHPRWQLTCKDCGLAMHSDAVGSSNILAFNKPGIIRDGAKAAPAPRTHQWDNHRWVLRAKSSQHYREPLAA